MLTKEEGGRHTPFFTNYRPQFFVRTADVTGNVTLPEGARFSPPTSLNPPDPLPPRARRPFSL